MAIVHDPMKCGGCGCDRFTVVNVRRDGTGRDTIGRLRLTCVECESVSEIAISAKLTVENVFGDGTLCGGW